ncbi:caspase, EACC1-associated type [Knoellia sp. CPCC 206450]|uniref:caspase, EACC1-associated type n=1 Tax=Knoellia tibetensis TaxID=3404798 RepID=UPI003B42EDA2
MPGSPDTRPAPDLPTERRLALVIATETYEDLSLRQLRAPGRDADDLRDVLGDSDIGGFEVTTVKDGTAQAVRVAVGDFLADRSLDDLVLVYLSCHGLMDLRRRLYFAARDTTKTRLAATGVESQWLLTQLEDCRARRQVLVLDCCFSGAFAAGTKGDDELGLGQHFLGQGRGRVVLTASRGSEYSFEGEPVPGQEVPGSVFTQALVEGLRSGSADLDRDGFVSVDDAYGFAFDRVRASDAMQTPQRWLYGAEGAILLARSPAGVTVEPAEVPAGITSSLDSSYPSVRIGGVDALAQWLDDDDPARVLAAQQTLAGVAEHDRPEVAARAREHLDAHVVVDEEAAYAVRSPTGAGSGSASLGGTERRAADTQRREDGIRRWLGTPVARLAAVGVLVAAGIATAAVLWDRDSGGSDDSSSSSPTSGSYTAEGPWRFELHGSGDGCTFTLEQGGTNLREVSDPIYSTRSFQVAQTGTFRWTASDSACRVVGRAGSGEATLPATFPPYRGDTDAFRATGPITVTVQDWEGNTECELTLRDPTDANASSPVDIRTVTTEQPSTVLDPGGREAVYLEDLTCGVRVEVKAQ